MQFLRPLFLLSLLFLSSTVFGRIYKAEKTRHQSNEINGAPVAMTIIVDQSGLGAFKTIQAAIDSIPIGNTNWIKVQISQGKYIEKVTIPLEKPFVYLQGQGRDKTFVTFNDHLSTDTSATFTSNPPNVLVKDITFQNSYNRAMRRPSSDFSDIKQAVAAIIYGDKSAFIRCGFVGFQDTLWDAQGRHYFKACYIEGAIDFIFGSGQSFYENAQINVTVGLLPDKGLGYITAQGRNSSDDQSGFVFDRGFIYGTGKALLGRAYGAFSRVIFYATNFADVVAPQGWDAWDYRGRENNFYYAESGCTGVGSNPAGRVPWVTPLSLEEIRQKYTRLAFIDQDNWISTLPELPEDESN